MIKKILILSLLTLTIAHAEIEQEGFFVGIDLANQNANVDNEISASSGNYGRETNLDNLNNQIISLKFGYEYFFTRVYARVSQYDYSQSDVKYSIKGNTYEFNIDYTPLIYTDAGRTWNIKGIIGVGLGINNSTISHKYSPSEQLGILFDSSSTQNFMEYGYQLGMLVETKYGINVEIATRYRSGSLFEFKDNSEKTTYFLTSTEYYLGVNMLF